MYQKISCEFLCFPSKKGGFYMIACLTYAEKLANNDNGKD